MSPMLSLNHAISAESDAPEEPGAVPDLGAGRNDDQ